MKIAILIDTWFPQIGGGQINAWEISKRIAGKNLNIDIITRNCGRDNLTYPKNLKLVKLGKRQSPNSIISKLKFVVDSFFYLNKKDYGLIHAHAFLPGITAKILMIFKKTPAIYTVHGTSIGTGLNSALVEAIENILLTQIKYDKEISVSRDFLKLKNTNKNVIYIPNGVDTNKIENVKVSSKNVFPALLFVGRLHKQKNLKSLFEAIPALIKNWPNLKLYIVGKGEQKTELQNLLKTLNLQRHIVFLGEKKGTELYELYKASDLFILPSIYEGQPIVLFEAWAAKLTPVVSATGDIPYLIKEGKNGFMIKGSTNPEQITKSIKKALQSNLSQISANGYNFVKKNYSWEKSANKTKEIYETFKKTGN